MSEIKEDVAKIDIALEGVYVNQDTGEKSTHYTISNWLFLDRKSVV